LSRLGATPSFSVMTDAPEAAPKARRRRSDAQRSIDAIVSSARTLLVARPDASMEEIADAADVSRQTVYAHFSSREALIAAVINVERAMSMAQLDAARLDRAPPIDAVRTFLAISWQLVDRLPLLLDPALARTPDPDGDDPHRPVAVVLERIIRRGQRSGDFDRALPVGWLAAATFGLGHTAAAQVAGGTLDLTRAATVLEKSVLRLYGVDAATRAGTGRSRGRGGDRP
jgi:AcrR family transcriptional regulator